MLLKTNDEKRMMANEDEIRKVWSLNKEDGFRMLMNSFQEPIYWHIRRLVICHDDAQDVFQDVFVQVFRCMEQFRNESSLSTWIYRIATNESLRFINKRKEKLISTEEVKEELLSKLEASGYVDYENELGIKFQQAILSLPEKQRIVFNLRYYDELEYTEISRITGDRVETLKTNYHYAKEKIKNIIINR